MALQLKLTQQMQYIILGAILACGALFAAVNFIVVPMISERKENLAKTAELQAKLDEQRAVVKTRADVQGQLDQAREKFRGRSASIPLPVLGNYLLGMEKNVRAAGADLDLQIASVVNQDILDLENTGFKVYRVRVTAKSGYRALLDFFRNLQESNPLLSISGLTITSREDSPETHDVSFTLAWLVWADPAKRPDWAVADPGASK